MIDPTVARAHARSVPHYGQAECAVDNQHPRPPRRPDGNQNPTVRETHINPDFPDGSVRGLPDELLLAAQTPEFPRKIAP